jgi:hypothetical protein
MSKDLISSLIAGIVSAGLYLLVMSLGLGFFFMFLPTLPILLTGLGRSPRLALYATLAATFTLTLVIGFASAFVFLIFLGLPAWYIADHALRWRNTAEGERQWYPLGLVFTYLTLYACATVAGLTFYYAGEEGGIQGMLTKGMHQTFADMEAQYGDLITAVISQWSFLIFSMTVWLWALALYAHAWFAQRMLASREKSRRPDMAITVFAMPSWMLSLMAICGLASLIGSPTTQFLGQSTLLSLLLPYFLLGAAVMHAASKTWPTRRFLLFFIYFMVFAQFWPALALSGVGLWHQIKRLSGRRGSSTS